MGIFRQFPYSNFHDMNMDEIIKIVRELFDEWATYHATWEDWKNGVDDTIASFYNWFNTLDVQEEINTKIDAMIADGTMRALIAPLIPDTVTDWLDAHITNPSSPPIDDSLTVQGAAADAKAAGDRITYLEKTAVFNETSKLITISNDVAGYVSTGDGQVYTTFNDAHNSGFVSIPSHVKKLVIKNTFRYSVDGFCFYDAANRYITGYTKSAFSLNEPYLIINIPTGAIKFKTTWWDTIPDPEVWAYNYYIEEPEEVEIEDVVNGFNFMSLNVFDVWAAGGTPVVTYNPNGSIDYTLPSISGNTGFVSNLKVIPTGKQMYLHLNYTRNDSTSTLKIYAYGTTKANVPDSYYNLNQVVDPGDNIIPIDTNWLEVYTNLDLSKPVGILFVNNNLTGGVCHITKFATGYYDNEPDDIYGYTLQETIDKIKSRLNNETIQLYPSEIMVAADGTKKVLQLDDNQAPVYIPVVPPKTFIFGNSLLTGFNSSYGISTNPYGMAASDKYHDYYYLFTQAIVALNPGATASKYRTSWENSTSAGQFASEAATMAAFLAGDEDLVIIQLGDNINTDTKKALFPDAAADLLLTIRAAAPLARVAWVGSWFNSALINEVLPDICRATGSVFVPISDIRSVDTQNVIGGVYYDDNGIAHTIESAGVASHPNDAGFAAITNRMLYILGISTTE